MSKAGKISPRESRNVVTHLSNREPITHKKTPLKSRVVVTIVELEQERHNPKATNYRY